MDRSNSKNADAHNQTLPEAVDKQLDKLIQELKIEHKSRQISIVYDGMLTQVARVAYYADESRRADDTTESDSNNKISGSDTDDKPKNANEAPPADRVAHSFIVKLIKNFNTLVDDFDVVPAFLREFIFYQKVLPNFVAFQKQAKGQNLFSDGGFLVPKYHKVVKEDEGNHERCALIFDDMTLMQGYTTPPKGKPLGLDHCKLVMEALGRLHGVSFAFKDQDPKQFSKFEKLIDPLFERISGLEHVIQDYVITCIDEAIDALDNHEIFRKEKLIELKENIFHTILSYVSLDFADPYCVIGHGDCLAQNLLFKCDPMNSNRPTSVCFLDFQLCRYASPILDLSYFFFTSTSSELRNEHLPSLMRLYYETVAATVKAMGSDPEAVFSWATFQQHLKRFGGYGFIMTMLQMDDIYPEEETDDARPVYQRQTTPEYSRRRGSITPIAPLHTIPLGELAKKTDRQKHLAGVVRDVIRLGYI